MPTTQSPLAILFFLAFVCITLWITYVAAKRTKSTNSFYTAEGKITAWQNGWALAGDFLSAGALLGIAGMITFNGFDGMVYSIGWLVGWPIMLFLIVEPLRSVGKFTMADLVAYRLNQRWVRSAAAVGSLTVILFYLIAQMVATGSLIKLLFGIPYAWSVVLVGAAMLIYVIFGGMIATTWVQVIKAILLLIGGALLSILVLREFNFNPQALFKAAADKFGEGVLQPGTGVVPSGWEAISLAMGLMFGTAAMPHVLMRVYTVKDIQAARRSIGYATGIIGVFHLFVLIIGFGCMVLVGREAVTSAGGGGNMAAPLLALALGGEAFFGFICAVAFATMLAVVAGLTLSGVATLSHDLWANVVRAGDAPEKEKMIVARISTVLIAVLAVGLGVIFEGQNVAFMAGLAFSVACAANFPALVLSFSWRGLTTAGAVTSILLGTVVCLVMIYLSPTIQVDVLKHSLTDIQNEWWFIPLRNPAIIAMPVSLLAAVIVSKLTADRDAAAKFDEMRSKVIFGNQMPPVDMVDREGTGPLATSKI
ncbi:cation acetate symporter [Rhizobium sp. BT-175]|uniref:solute symporter family protein n=1 Tax=Rhizobium sp. BT-175 TaxID=2986929 RepID=UPI002235EA27|nr:cation acetate symporter [Rhizobium sp. BT-175]MCV9947593.1 cation acetate symporter [Rhizobium sp. BT-175]